MLTVENRGIEDTSNYSVELIDMISGDKIAEAKGLEVKAADRSQVTLRWTAQKAGPVKLQARVVSDSDPVKDNNDSYPYIAQVLPADNTAIAINHGDETLKVMAYPINYYAVESMTQSIFPAMRSALRQELSIHWCSLLVLMLISMANRSLSLSEKPTRLISQMEPWWIPLR